MTVLDAHCNGVAGSQSDVLLDATRQEAGPQEVEVDQRALVNILARYPGEFDVLRELIQNAEDAEAKSVQVHFQTEDPKKPQPAGGFDVTKVTVCKWIVINSGGNTFTKEDWGRLKRIADGNKSSTKVGAFGIGFYSVLSKTDRPLVKSSNKSLQFVRGEDGKLRNHFIDCPTTSGTSIELELRNPEPLPKLANLARFLVSSVTFLTNIETAEVYLDDTRLLRIQKESCKAPVEIPIPQHLVGTTSSQALTVKSIEHTVQTITIDATECTIPSDQPTLPSVVDTADTLVERRGRPGQDYITRTSQSVNTVLEANAITHDLYIATIDVNLHPDSEMSRGVESFMKSLPSTFKCRAVYLNPEQSHSLDGMKNSRSHKTKHLACLFSGPQGIAPENEGGRLFIGQSTNQTTGIGLHISAHFLPTMERSSIDLANGQVAAWNHEVLKVSGFLARIVYEEEMRTAAGFKNDLATKLGLSTMARFAFGSTLPHGGVSQILRDAFYSCCHESKSPLPVVSAVGISCASDPQFRQSNKDLSFLKRYRVLHEEIKDHQSSRLITQYDIPRFKYGDIVKEFEVGVTQEAMRSFFSWWEDTKRNSLTTDEAKSAAETFCTQFASRGVLHTSHGTRMQLKNIKHYTFFPLPNVLSPPDTIYIDVSSGLPSRDSVEAFGWSQLSLLDWLQYAHAQARQHTLDGASGPDSDMGHRISRALVQFALVESLSQEQWNRVAELMRDLKCIPTNMGLKMPGESYFEEADICKSLPVALESDFLSIPMTPAGKSFPFEYRSVNPEHVRKVLVGIRVPPVMDWKHMIEKLEDTASEETNDRLLQFLGLGSGILQPLLPKHWRNDLQEKKVFYSNGHGRVSATELYLPHEDVLKLKLPILALPRDGFTTLQNVVDPSGAFQMEPFVERLGVQRYPPLEKVIALAASNDPEVQQSARRYLLSNLDTRYSAYKPENFADVSFIPTQTESLARLNEVFASPIWEKLGFKLVSKDLRRNYSRLGGRDDPSVDMIIEHLKVPETTLPDLKTAATWFDHLYVHGKLPILKLREHLSTIPFVPVKNSSASSSGLSPIDYISPKDCFIVSPEAKEHHRNIFPYVDFGQNGNGFLEHCGAKKSPDASDIVRRLYQGPQRYLEALQNNYDLYLEDLRTITSRLDSMPEDDKQAMKKAPMFLAFRIPEKKLLPADQVIIGDWESRDFCGVVFEAPKDSTLEKMYSEMGSEFLGKYVRYDIRPTHHQADHNPTFERVGLIRRIKCFMDQRDNSTKTDVSFYDQKASSYLEVKVCKKITLKKTFAPPFGILADGEPVRTVEAKVKAGLEFNQPDGSYTLWIAPVKGENAFAELRNDIAVGLCHILLKTYTPGDVLFLASLLSMDDKSLDKYFGSETIPELPDPPPAKAKSKNKVTVELMLPFVGKIFGGLKPFHPVFRGKRAVPPEDDVNVAITMCAIADPNGQPPDFSAPSQSRPGSVKHVSHCKEACKICLREQDSLLVEGTRFRFFLADDAQRQHRQPVLQEFAKLVCDLAHVYRLDASTACYIFWKDTDEDLMAFNRDQRYIFFNLAYHEREFHTKQVDKKKVVTEWFLIMAHELAHNITLDHDEYHGALTSRIAVTYFPALREKFAECFSERV